jgi:hypothetical protein
MQEVENILRIFQETKKAVERGDSIQIKLLSNQTNNTASLTGDPDNIAVAVIVYSLSKIIERENYKTLPGWKNFYNLYLKSIDEIILALKKNDETKARKYLESIRIGIEKISGRLKEYIQDVFRNASINKASKLYEHGISMERTSKLLGVTMFELASYAGQRTDDFPKTTTLDVRQRIKIAEEMFR